VVEPGTQISEIAALFGISPITAGKWCAHLKTDANGNTTYTTATHGKKLVEQFRWNSVGKAACIAVLSSKT
jgi:hypothetical protein